MDKKFESTCFLLKVVRFIMVFSLVTTLIFVEVVHAQFEIPRAYISYTPILPSEGETITFDASNSYDWQGTIVNFDWDFGDGTTGTGKVITHSYSAGSYTVILTVTDNDGHQDTETERIAVASDIPSAIFSHSPPFPSEDDTLTFDASDSRDFDGTIDRFDWDFGDGTTGTGRVVTHSYSAGSYTVILTVTDNDGHQDTETKKIDVDEEWDSSPFNFFEISFYAIFGFFAIVLSVILIIILIVLKKRKSAEMIPSLEKETGEELQSADTIHFREKKKFLRRSDNTIALLKTYIENPNSKNDKKAWKAFRDLADKIEKSEGQFGELIKIRNAIALLRRNRDEDRRCGRDELADESESDIQNNYVESIEILKQIQQKFQ